MIVELSGPTGAGKTYLGEKIAEGLASAGHEICCIHDDNPHKEGIPNYLAYPSQQNWKTDFFLLPWSLVFLFSNPSFFLFLISSLIKVEESLGNKIAIFRSIHRKCGGYVFFRRKKFANKIVLIDEGLFHTLHNVFVSVSSGLEDKDAKTFAQLVALPDVLLILQTNENEILSRLKNRGDWSSRVRSEQELASFVSNACRAFSTIASDARIAANSHAIDSNKADDIERIIQTISNTAIKGNNS